MRQVRELTDLRIDEISLVDKGANQHAIVSIAKRDGAEEETMDDEYFDSDGHSVDVDELDYGDVVYDSDGNGYEVAEDEGFDGGGVEKNFDEDRVQKADDKKTRASAGGRAGALLGGPIGSAIQAKEGRRLRAAGNVLGGTTLGSYAGQLSGGLAGALTRRPQAAASGASLGGAVGSIGGTVAGVDRAARKGHLKDKWVKKSYGEELREEFSKALSDNDRDEVISKALDYIDTVSESAEAAFYAAEMERDARLEAEFTEVAKGYSVGVEPEVLGPVLKRLTEVMDEDDVNVIVTALSTASDVVEKSFEEVGTNGLGSHSDVLQAVDSVVDNMVSKSNGDFSREEAISGIFAENPEAYDEYLAERRYL